ncbi:cyclase family protein [Kibdelosporangium phytohabitans]|uniref:Cyclase n=1 Tax=Kibdelosporangium phytohabitans TaxID=860235 RepID=A0A0N9I5S1_9PSEU|nr:cyclase family protein [Kibdelosporangium phytohabitans]ALG11005.1 cyclase [Kibdelosporangium phytohabitans]MBE1462228.1 kynurenine formamidase [Kibdelosporangium phytohabitans]
MGLLDQLRSAIGDGGIEIVDLTAPLTSGTPILQLPEPFSNTIPFRLEEISRYDDRGPAWYWNNIHTGEHTGTHLDVPVHWVSGKDGHDVSEVPLKTLVAPAVVIDVSAGVGDDPDFLLQIDDVKNWEAEHGALPDGGWLLVRSGWSARSDDSASFLNESHSPGMSAECARWLAEETALTGVGVETVGTDAGAAHSFEPPFPCHNYLLGAGKHGLTQLRNLDALPATGAVLLVSPLPIVGGSGSPARVLALVER